jgi:hypothetical protein
MKNTNGSVAREDGQVESSGNSSSIISLSTDPVALFGLAVLISARAARLPIMFWT